MIVVVIVMLGGGGPSGSSRIAGAGMGGKSAGETEASAGRERASAGGTGVSGVIGFGGSGKVSNLMGDFAKGIKSFKKGLADEEASPPPPPPRTIDVDHRDETTTPNKDTTTRS